MEEHCSPCARRAAERAAVRHEEAVKFDAFRNKLFFGTIGLVIVFVAVAVAFR